jgi:uncharacterized membrane protein YfhO
MFRIHLNLIDDEEDARRIPHGNLTYIIAFVIPLVMYIALYYVRDIYPFGDNCYLRSDMYHQYAPFFMELWDKLRNGESLAYSWDIGMGTNFVALYAYYLASPINWFIVLFPKAHMIEMMNGIIIFKEALASVTFTYYLSKHFHNKRCTLALFGMFYSMSGFLAAYSWNIMWLDCIVLLPLIFLGLERLVNENKCLLYAVTLGLCVYTNYYISIMVCISIVLYFIVLMFSYSGNRRPRIYLKKILHFIVYTLLGGGLAACLLLPEMYAFSLSASSSSTFPTTLSNYFSIVDMLDRQLMDIPVHMGLEHHPNVYCGVMVFLLLPLYFMNSRAKLSERFGKGLLILFFLISYNLNIPNYIWHGFHYPNSLPARQSFIYIFFLLSMCYEGFYRIREYSARRITTAIWIAIGLLIYMESSLNEMYEWQSVYISAAFVIAYAILMMFYNRQRIKTPILLFLIFALSIIECTINMEKTGLGTTSRVSYLLDNNAVDSLMDYIEDEDDGFYRIEKSWGLKTKNDSAWHGYKSISTFSSTSSAGITELLGAFGCEHSMNAYAYQGSTLATASIFNVKYIISNKLLPESNLFTFKYGNDGEFLYENTYTLPVGFMVDSQLESLWNTSTANNGIEVQNQFFSINTGIDDVFKQLYVYRTDMEVTFTPTENAHLYAYIQNVNCDVVTVNLNDKMFNYSGLKSTNHLIDIGYATTDDQVTLTADTSMNATVYALDEEKFIQAYNILNSQGLQVTSHDETSISGDIYAARNGLMFFSIPYDAGWTVKVDGKKVTTFAIKDALLGIQLDAGQHTVELSYRTVNLIPGIMISLACLLLLIAAAATRKMVTKGTLKTEGLPWIIRDYLAVEDVIIEGKRKDEDNDEDNDEDKSVNAGKSMNIDESMNADKNADIDESVNAGKGADTDISINAEAASSAGQED